MGIAALARPRATFPRAGPFPPAEGLHLIADYVNVTIPPGDCQGLALPGWSGQGPATGCQTPQQGEYLCQPVPPV